MNTQRPTAKSLSDRILFFVHIAQENHAAIALDDLVSLLPAGWVGDSGELERFIRTFLGDRLLVQTGYVVEKGREYLIGTSTEARLESAKKIAQVKKFVSSNPKLFSDALIVAVAGSASYGSANSEDDVDIFVVTRNGSLWRTLLKVLLYVRVKKLTKIWGRNDGLPELCFSIVFTERGFKELLGRRSDPLSARELISLKPVKGGHILNWYLANTSWVFSYYPRHKPTPQHMLLHQQQQLGRFSRGELLDHVLYLVIGDYLEFVAKLRNIVFRLSGRHQQVFSVIKSEDKLIYESNRYIGLRKKYYQHFFEGGDKAAVESLREKGSG